MKEYTRGRIVLSYYFQFPLMGLVLLALYIVVTAMLSENPFLYELRVFRTVPMLIGSLFVLIPLALLIGFWVGSDYDGNNLNALIKPSLWKAAAVTAIYSGILLTLNFIFRAEGSYLWVILCTGFATLLGTLFSGLIIKNIARKGVKELSREF